MVDSLVSSPCGVRKLLRAIRRTRWLVIAVLTAAHFLYTFRSYVQDVPFEISERRPTLTLGGMSSKPLVERVLITNDEDHYGGHN